MAKIIFLVLGVLLAYWILKGGHRRNADQERRASPQPGGEETMVRCAKCGVHLPRGESIMTGGQYFCSVEHQRLHQTSS